MGFWQWVVVVLWALKFLIHLQKDGEPMNMDYSASRVALQIAIMFIILCFGGFFN